MTVLIIDGPEKTGKSTTIKAITAEFAHFGIGVQYHHWGLVKDFTDYVEMLKEHTSKRDIIHIWDRSWASEYVYGQLMYRKDHTMTNDHWLGAWCLDRAADANGLKVILIPDKVEDVMAKRDESDLITTLLGEIFLYNDYALMYDWDTYFVAHNDESQYQVARKITLKLLNRLNRVSDPTRLCGPVDSPVLFIGETKSTQYIRGGFLPFTSRYTTMFGRDIGRKAILARWTNITDVVPEDFDRTDLVVLCGAKAYTKYNDEFRKEVKPGIQVLPVPHPSYLYRYHTDKVNRTKTEALSIVNNVLKEL